ncbi:MAG: hypothetical protein ACLFVJ_18725 [Persicimonas sp.]
MAQHQETAGFDGPFADDDPVGRLLEFYMANGYRVVDRQRAGRDAEATDEDAALQMASFERGRAGAGWWTSNMTELHTRVVVELADERVRLSYNVDTTGQMLNEVERAFWRRELQAARRYMLGEASEPRDLREDEAQRAQKQKGSLLSMGLWGAVAVFVFIVFLGFIGII